MLKAMAFVLLAVPAVAVAQAPTAPQAPASVEVKKNPLDKMICKTEETIGSRLGAHKVCATLREWKEQEEQNREEFGKIQRNTDIAPSG